MELFYRESDTLVYETPEGKCTFSAGSGGLVNTGVLHTTQSICKEKWTVQWLHIFDPVLLYGDVDSRIYRKYFAPILTSSQTEIISLQPNLPRQGATIERLKLSFLLSEQEHGYELKLREILASIWLDLAEIFHPEAASGNDSNDRIKLMMIFIREHYQKDILVEDVTAAGFVSVHECYRLFQTYLHTTPGKYIRNFRLKTARRLLAETEESITRISQSCGFGSSFFGKTFLSHFGVPPYGVPAELAG